MGLFIVVIVHTLLVRKEIESFKSPYLLKVFWRCSLDVFHIQAQMFLCVFSRLILLFHKILITLKPHLFSVIIWAVVSRRR